MFSIVIPTYREENYIGSLLRSIEAQTLQPTEIIVADRPSGDKTRKIARKHGCKVVEGGTIPVGRNAGAKAANEEILLFLDADTVLPRKDFLEKFFDVFVQKNLDCATCYYTPIEKNSLQGRMVCNSLNSIKTTNQVFFLVFKKIFADSGAIFACRKSYFNKVGGFDEKMIALEDSNFTRNVVRSGAKFGVIPLKIAVSQRRFKRRTIFGSIGLGILAFFHGLASRISGNSATIFSRAYERQTGDLGGE